ncbi:MAG: hypothetical protein ABR911_12230 [Syntrophales bacterium]
MLGNLLIEGIPAYKNYTNMPGYDLVATIPDENTSARIQIKSRWATKSTQFLIKNFDCDFVVIVKLNRGSKDGTAAVLPPEFYVLPIAVMKKVPRTKAWGRVAFRDIPKLESYRQKWQLIRDFLKGKKKKSKRKRRKNDKHWVGVAAVFQPPDICNSKVR